MNVVSLQPQKQEAGWRVEKQRDDGDITIGIQSVEDFKNILYKYIPNQGIVLFARSDWLLKLRISYSPTSKTKSLPVSPRRQKHMFSHKRLLDLYAL